ncbi:MAG TPA: hypothetical protein VNF50_13810 [Acidimicrobiales bacterium]|nr:hypothetical protein [Acidimicrobiales bacterium]
MSSAPLGPVLGGLLLRGLLLGGLLLGGLVGFVLPAAAVQTDAYGIAPAPGSLQSGGDHLQAVTRPGAAVHDQLLVWNRTGAPLTLDLSVEPAHLAPGDVPALGGATAPTRWVHLDQPVVQLGPHADQIVSLTITVPRILPHLPAQAAVVATPETSTPGHVAVLIRLAVLISMDAAPSAPSRAPLGTVGWVGLAVLAAVALTVAAVRVTSRRGRSPNRSD